jgi:hypothetical protein
MVKKPKNPTRPGRPAVMSDADKRTERIAIRAHPDLVYYLSAGAREEGLVRSVYIERILIGYLNQQWGHPVVDNIGREIRRPQTFQCKVASCNYARIQQNASRFERMSSIIASRFERIFLSAAKAMTRLSLRIGSSVPQFSCPTLRECHHSSSVTATFLDQNSFEIRKTGSGKPLQNLKHRAADFRHTSADGLDR